MEEIRLQKYLAECGIASRRKCEQYILDGFVKVNNELVTELGTKINPEKDVVTFKEKRVKVPVGRLDMYTSGALILTNDGDFVYKVTHPKYEIEKTYTATLARRNNRTRNRKIKTRCRNRGLYKQTCKGKNS